MRTPAEFAAYHEGLAEVLERASRVKPAHPDGRLLMENGPSGTMRCYVDCPAVGYRREVAAIEYKDGGRLVFPHDFSSKADPKSIRDAMPLAGGETVLRYSAAGAATFKCLSDAIVDGINRSVVPKILHAQAQR